MLLLYLIIYWTLLSLTYWYTCTGICNNTLFILMKHVCLLSAAERVWRCSCHSPDLNPIYALSHNNSPQHYCTDYIRKTRTVRRLHAGLSNANYTSEVNETITLIIYNLVRWKLISNSFMQEKQFCRLYQYQIDSKDTCTCTF